MGSGTTQAVAMKLGRRFLGADINLGAIQTTTKRLIGIAQELSQQTLDADDVKYTGFEVYNVNNYDFFRNPVEARDLIIQALEIQPFEQSNVWDGEKDGRMVKIMPVNRRWPVDTLLSACRDYFAKTGRRISFEYTMIDGVSDSPEQAQLLAKKLAGMGAHVNMIPLNNVTESGLHTSSRQAIRRFQTILEENGVTATLRRTLGSDIDASCGQLRRKYESN